MHEKLSQLFARSGVLIFFEADAAPKSSNGYRLPLTVDLARVLDRPRTVSAIARELSAVAKEQKSKHILATMPLMRPFVTLAAEKAHLPFIEFDGEAKQVVRGGGGDKALFATLVYDVFHSDKHVREDVECLQKISVHVSHIIVFLDFMQKGSDEEIARRKWFLRENISIHSLLTIEEWLQDLAQQKKFTLELAEHLISYFRNPRAVDPDQLWWMKYHELLARNRLI